MRYEAPLNPGLVDELMDFWAPIFVEGIDLTREALLGHESPDARITVYTRRIDGELAGACLVASSDTMPSLGGLGEVGTSPAARRTGIATALTQQALDDFRERGGQALFLGTVNPTAARIYHRLGWRKLAGANLMVNVSNGESPEEFFVDYFRAIRGKVVNVRMPSPADRAPMIPLLVSPHDWHALDLNTGMMSTRYAVQDSCLGLYRRYAAMAGDGRGAWFCASTDAGHVVGLSTARLDEDGNGCRVDGFTHRNHQQSWHALIQAAVEWGADRKAAPLYAEVSVEDDEKRALFESAGFTDAVESEPFDLGGRQVGTLRLELR
ncbi:MAG: GNAT family N-acetyltransferase [Chloroflexi bacterium]|nr:GNAT family N-acetyltransferase [Chloroflexota bacterium]